MIKNLFLYLIRFYQKNISPCKGTTCPYIPSCSAYGMEAIKKHGAIWGGVLTVYRILRCNPFSKGGYDPVPEKIDHISIRNVYCKFRRKNH